MKKTGILFINLAVLLFGAASVLAKGISQDALQVTFGRVLFSSITLFLFMRGKHIAFKLRSRNDLYLLLGAGIILALHWWTFLASVKLASVAIAAITFASFPLFVTFAEPLLGHKRICIQDILFAFLIMIGIGITSPLSSMNENMLLGTLAGILAAFLYAVLTLFNKKIGMHYNGTQISFYEQATAAIVLLPFALANGLHWSRTDFLLLLILGIFTTALAHTLFISSLKTISARAAGISSAMETIYSILLAIPCLGEYPTSRQIIGGIVIIGVVLFTQLNEEKREIS